MGNEVSAQVGPEDTKKRVVLESKNTLTQATHQFTWYDTLTHSLTHSY
jgi:hypothetical protein